MRESVQSPAPSTATHKRDAPRTHREPQAQNPAHPREGLELRPTTELGAGAALDGATESRMRSAIGPVPPVRVHTDAAAGRVSRSMGAKAFAFGPHIGFAPGAFRPGTLEGDVLLAHELAHSQQQRGAGLGAPPRSPRPTAASSTLETHADHAAIHAASVLHLGGQGVARAQPRSGLRMQACQEPDRRTWAQLSERELADRVVNALSGHYSGAAPTIIMQAVGRADSETLARLVRGLKLRPHHEHTNYYLHLLAVVREAASTEQWNAFAQRVGAPRVSGEAPLALSPAGQTLLTTVRTHLVGAMNVPALLMNLGAATRGDLDQVLTALRRTYDATHGHQLHALSAGVRARGTPTQYRSFVQLIHSRTLPNALREADPWITQQIQSQAQLVQEGGTSSLSDEEMAGLFASRALNIAYTMLRSSEAQIVRLLSRTRGGGGPGPALDADVERARQALNRNFDPDLPAPESFADWSARVRARLGGQSVSEDGLRSTYNRQLQIALYRAAVPHHRLLRQEIATRDRELATHNEYLNRRHVVIQHPFYGPGVAGMQAQAIRRRWNEHRAQATRLERERGNLRRIKGEIEAQLPLLGGLTDAGLERLAGLRSGAAFDNLLHESIARVFGNIEEARQSLHSGEVRVWLLPPIVAAARRELGLDAEGDSELKTRWNRVIQAQIRASRADQDKLRRSLEILNLGALIVAVGTALWTGGGSLAIYAGLAAEGIAVTSAIVNVSEAYRQLARDETAYGTGLTDASRLADVPPDYQFLHQVWLGLGITLALSAFSVTQLVRAGRMARLRGEEAAVQREVRAIARDLRARGVQATEAQIVDATMEALRRRGWVAGTGGVRGVDVYDLRGDALSPQRIEKRLAPMVGEARLHGATLTDSASGGRVLVVPQATGQPLRVRVEVTPSRTLPTGPHGAESGPAVVALRRSPGTGEWSARIVVHRSVRDADLRLILGHELDEIADIVRRNPTASQAVIDAQQQAGVFRRGSTATTPTAHDHAAARELRAMYDDLDRTRQAVGNMERAGSTTSIKYTEESARLAAMDARYQRMLAAMGLDEGANMANKIATLRQAGFAEEVLGDLEGRVLLGQYRGSAGYRGLEGGDPLLRREGSAFTERSAGHMIAPGPPAHGGFLNFGISGGHTTERLLAWVRANPNYAVVEQVARARSAGGTTFRYFDQYEWIGAGRPPTAAAARPGGAAMNPADWQRATVPKTTADDITVWMREAESAFANWRRTYPAAYLGQDSFGAGATGPLRAPAVSSNGVEFSGFYNKTPSALPGADPAPSLRTAFVEASWF